MGVISSIKKNGLKYVTPLRVWAYIRSKYRGLFGIRVKQSELEAISEIIVYKGLVCSECKQRGACVKCECPWTELVTSLDVPCSDGKFPAFKGDIAKQWEEEKEKQGIFINLLYSK